MTGGGVDKAGSHGCYEPMMVAGFQTRCVLDAGHDGPHKSYAHVLNLQHLTNQPPGEMPTKREMGVDAPDLGKPISEQP